MTAVDVGVVRGDSLVFTVEFFTDADGTVSWDEVGDFDPVCQVRLAADASVVAVTPALDVTDNVVTFGLTDDQTAALAARPYVWDVQLTDPDADDGLGVFTWPGAGDPRNTLTVTADVTRVTA